MIWGCNEKLAWLCQSVLRSWHGYIGLYGEVGMVISGCAEKLVWLRQAVLRSWRGYIRL